ncbi:MAG: gliding motility-associated C-terminal domain-containing protein [Pricia sp.]
MTIQNPPAAVFRVLIIFCFCLVSNATYAQCAGTDNAGTARAVTICMKDTDEANKTFDLSLYLGPHNPGGTWSTNDPANFFALNRSTGIVNLWNIKNSGEHQFTYTNTCAGITDSAVVTINLGGYPGEENIDGTAAACGDDTRVNLFRYIGDEVEGKSQDFNGIWAALTPGAAAHLQGNIFNAETAGPGIYEFTHTVPAVDTCSERSVRLILQVQRPANSGTGADEIVCVTDDLSTFTNYDLNSLLTDEDVNGTWSEVAPTNQLTDLTDRNIDIQAIRDNHGPGTYTFTYTVFPEFAVCERNSTEVNIIILPTLNGTMEAPNYCVGPSEYRIAITEYDQSLMSSGTYRDMSIEISSASSTRREEDRVLELEVDGTGYFDVQANLIPLNEIVTVSIISLGEEVCGSIQVAPVSFAVTDPSATVLNACEGEDLNVSLTNIFDASSSRANGAYDITYTLTAPDTSESTYAQNGIVFNAGNATFDIPAAQLTETGEYNIHFDVASGFSVDCALTDTATITAIPSSIQLDLMVDNSCNATQIEFAIDAPVLGDGTYSITYDVIEQATGNVVNTLSFPPSSGGPSSYALDVAAFEPGNYTVTVRSTQNDTTPCRTEFEFEESENFAVNGIPALPEAEAQQNFCLSAFSPDAPTLADVDVTANGQILFYATATDMDILALDTPLADNTTYFISNIDPNNNCEGSDRVQVTVSLQNPERPIATGTNPVFCDSENPTVANLNASIDGNMNVVWFDAAIGGNLVESTAPISDGTSYFAATETQGGCVSIRRLEITPTVYALEPVSLQFAQLALCGLDNPTVANLSVTENSNPFEVLWYDVAESGSPLTDDIRLTANTTYYAESFNPATGCVNPERMAVTVDLANCDPEDYGFFIPDGFSPNGDGRNDTFFIPNIEIIFPDFTLEILNRYGSSLFKGDRNNPAWNGEKAVNGVYFYIVDYQKEGHEAIQGRLYLNR